MNGKIEYSQGKFWFEKDGKRIPFEDQGYPLEALYSTHAPYGWSKDEFLSKTPEGQLFDIPVGWVIEVEEKLINGCKYPVCLGEDCIVDGDFCQFKTVAILKPAVVEQPMFNRIDLGLDAPFLEGSTSTMPYFGKVVEQKNDKSKCECTGPWDCQCGDVMDKYNSDQVKSEVTAEDKQVRKLVNDDDVAMFASMEDKLIYEHFFFKGIEYARTEERNKTLQEAIDRAKRYALEESEPSHLPSIIELVSALEKLKSPTTNP